MPDLWLTKEQYQEEGQFKGLLKSQYISIRDVKKVHHLLNVRDSNYWHIKVAGYEDAARAMVAEMADMLREIRFEEAEGEFNDFAEMKLFRRQIDQELIELNLKPIKMPEQKMTYEERVDNMAKSINAAATGYAPYKEVVGNFYVRGAAKEAVYRQAEAIRDAMMHVFESCGIYPEIAKTTIDWYIQEHGYIEPKTEGAAFYCHDYRYAADMCVAHACKIQCGDCKIIEPKTKEDGDTRGTNP